MDEQKSELVAQFSNVTGARPDAAQGALEASNWHLDEAVALFYASQDAAGDDQSAALPQATDPTQSLAAAASSSSASASASASTTRKQPAQGSSKLKTLRDIGGDGDEDSDEDEKQDFFAGGEKSGLAVQNPNNPSDLIKNMINQARQNRPRPGGDDDDEPQRASNFTGRAQTLGGDDAPSQVIEDPDHEDEGDSNALPLVQRTLHLWNDGFSVDDGDLYRFDDPANAAAVATINQGRAPQSILNVQHNQRVDLNLVPHNEDYKQPAKVYKPFGGSGRRLGTPTPGVSSSASASAPAPTTQSSQSSSQAAAATIQVDDSQPVVTIQIRLGDGSRLSSRFNTTHTVAQLFQFVDTSSANPGRPYTLMTTFPSKELGDRSATLASIDALKKGGVVVQKWT